MTATKSPKDLREAFSTVDTAVACARLTDEERAKSNAALFAVRDALERLARIEEATADLAEIRNIHDKDDAALITDGEPAGLEHKHRAILLDTVARLTSELATSRAVTDKTAIERDRFHDELIHEQAKVLRVAMAIENPDLADKIREVVTEAERIPQAIKCQRVADGVVGLLRMAINPRAKS